MKRIHKKKIRKILQVLMITAFLSLPAMTDAQVGGDPPPPPDDPGAPIDGGLSILLAAGAAYGVKKYRDGRKAKEDDVEK